MLCYAVVVEGQEIDFTKYSLLAVWSQKAPNMAILESPKTRYVKQTGIDAYEWCIDITLADKH